MSTTQAIANRNAAVAQVAANTQPTWADVAFRAVKWVAEHHYTFTSDDVWDAVNLYYPNVTTHEPRAMGPVLMKAVRAGICSLLECDHCGTRKVMVMSRRSQANGMDTPVYRSLINK